MIKYSALIFASCFIALPTWAINKCTAPNGKVVFQDLPCQGAGEKLDVRPASGSVPPPTVAVQSESGSTGTDKPLTELERLKQSNIRSENERKRSEIESLTLPDAYARLDRHLAACEREYRSLQNDKRYAKNNLAGATWEQALSQEMHALTSKCDNQTRLLTSNVEEIKRQCQRLGGCQ